MGVKTKEASYTGLFCFNMISLYPEFLIQVI